MIFGGAIPLALAGALPAAAAAPPPAAPPATPAPPAAAAAPPVTVLTAGANNHNGDIFITPTGDTATYANEIGRAHV